MGRVFLVELEGRSFYKCRFCHSHLALVADVVSWVTESDFKFVAFRVLWEICWSFTCRRGRAYLFSDVVNITVGPQEERLMLSGMHTVEDIFCCCCGQILGWKYILAHDKNQQYKEGKFVLERWRIAEEVIEEVSFDAHPGLINVGTP
ncbi:hypothetical protein JRO89_XS06G0066700 [Xanthoceras sorbifolium]|uniref:Protein yippee-like n=1 Tax=Xanthoceras sorbifolium TaxID=99658 RepID=A0ABQ8HWZ2_9ROSI|nr:hypothetical protein JRO89_XS06G0066700 [Xanthoceras sorbifolium]